MEKADTNRGTYYYKVLIGLLEGELGQHMAMQAVKQYCSELLIKETEISDNDLDAIAKRLSYALEPFMEQEQLVNLIQQITMLKEYDDWGNI